MQNLVMVGLSSVQLTLFFLYPNKEPTVAGKSKEAAKNKKAKKSD